MAKTFNLMRGNDLIWNYVVNNWMKGEDPPAFDLLTWNADSTRMPAEMHSFYLRSCYLENQLARGVMEIAGETLNIKSVDQDLYFLAAEQDHIAPWRSSYIGRPTAGRRRAVRAVEFRPHRRHRQSAEPQVEALRRRLRRPAGEPGQVAGDGDHASRAPGGRTGRPGSSRAPASRSSRRPWAARQYPVLGDAPGTYVFGK